MKTTDKCVMVIVAGATAITAIFGFTTLMIVDLIIGK